MESQGAQGTKPGPSRSYWWIGGLLAVAVLAAIVIAVLIQRDGAAGESEAFSSFDHYEIAEPEGSVREDGFNIPIYGTAKGDEEWMVVVFYRPPDCVPADFNLLDFFHEASGDDPGAVGCGPPTVDGYQIWSEPPGPGAQLISAELDGQGVPIWFVPTSNWAEATSDRQLTIEELSSVSTRKGEATAFHEVTRADIGGGSFAARGDLDDGTAFELLHKGRDGVVEVAHVSFG